MLFVPATLVPIQCLRASHIRLREVGVLRARTLQALDDHALFLLLITLLANLSHGVASAVHRRQDGCEARPAELLRQAVAQHLGTQLRADIDCLISATADATLGSLPRSSHFRLM